MTITIINLSTPTKELPQRVKNWNEIPEAARKALLETEYFMVRNSQSVLLYNGRQCVIDCMAFVDYETREIELQNGYNKEGKLFEV